MIIFKDEVDNLFKLWKALKEEGVPDFLVFLFTTILWPLALWVYTKRRVGGVPNLEVYLKDHAAKINEVRHEGVYIYFANKTGSIVYLSNPRFVDCTPHFWVHLHANRNIADCSYELKFRNEYNKQFDSPQEILQTNDAAVCWIALRNAPDEALLNYHPGFWRKTLQKPKYFKLDFLALVGESKYRVRLVY